MEKTVDVMFSCGHEGSIETHTTVSMLNTEKTSEVNPEIVQYAIFQKKVVCPSCSAKVWEN